LTLPGQRVDSQRMTQPLAQRVATEVRAEMARQRVSQDALAAAIGMSQAAVSRRLSGDIPFDVAELEDVATALRVPISQFLAERVA